MQVLQEEKSMEVCHSTSTGKDDLDSFSCVSSTVLTKSNQREGKNQLKQDCEQQGWRAQLRPCSPKLKVLGLVQSPLQPMLFQHTALEPLL